MDVYNFEIRCCFIKKRGLCTHHSWRRSKVSQVLCSRWFSCLLLPLPNSHPPAQCSWRWVPDPLQTGVMERVAPVCSLTYVAAEKWRKIHSVPLAAGECWSVRFVLSEPNFQYTLREDEPNVCVSLFIRNG